MNRFLLGAWLLTLAVGCGGKNNKPPTPDPTNTETPGDAPVSEKRPDAAGSAGSESPAGESPGSSAASTAPPPVEPDDPNAIASADLPASWDPELASNLSGLVSDDPSVREQAGGQLDALAGDRVALTLPYTQHPDAPVRRGAYFFLVDRFQPADAGLVAAFTRALQDDDDTVRRMGLQVLRRMQAADVVKAVPRIATLLKPERADETSRANVARMLGTLGSEAEPARAAVQEALAGDPSERVRGACAFALAQIAAPADAAERLGKTLREDPAAQVRYVAAARLGRLPNTADVAALASAQLAPGLGDADEKVQQAVAEGLQRHGSAAVPALIEQLEAEKLQTRKLAVVVLGRLGPLAKDAVAPLKTAAAAEDADEELQKLVPLVLARIVP